LLSKTFFISRYRPKAKTESNWKQGYTNVLFWIVF